MDMDRSTIRGILVDYLISHFSLDEAAVTDNASLSNDLGMDSVDAVETAITLEDKFDIEISDSDFSRLITVGDVLDYLSNKLSSKV